MRVFVVGGGGREHALVWKLAQSPARPTIYCAPGNAGIAALATRVPIKVDQLDDLVAFARDQKIDLVVVGPEAPLVDGLADRLRAAGLLVFGCSQAAAAIEGSKIYMKELCARHAIPTAAFGVFDERDAAERFIDQSFAAGATRLVVKADGLAAGKGVTLCDDASSAKRALAALLADSSRVVIEEFLVGREASLLAFVSGDVVVPFDGAEDHKTIFDGDRGPMTGGMGTVSPTPTLSTTLRQRALDELLAPTARAMVAEGRRFDGLLFAGVMLTASGPKLLEYNCRFGDPETQVLMRRLDGDLLPSLLAVANGQAAPSLASMTTTDHAVAVVMASRGYPESSSSGDPIVGLDIVANHPNVVVFHAGTESRRSDDRIVTNGGRVLAVSATGVDTASARAAAYAAVQQISFAGAQYRSDIGDRHG